MFSRKVKSKLLDTENEVRYFWNFAEIITSNLFGFLNIRGYSPLRVLFWQGVFEICAVDLWGSTRVGVWLQWSCMAGLLGSHFSFGVLLWVCYAFSWEHLWRAPFAYWMPIIYKCFSLNTFNTSYVRPYALAFYLFIHISRAWW